MEAFRMESGEQNDIYIRKLEYFRHDYFMINKAAIDSFFPSVTLVLSAANPINFFY